MAKELLRCDICGGSIVVQAGGKKGICENCGASYSLERMREIYSGMKVSVTGTKEDVEQWKRLVETYLQNLDFAAAESVVKKILEAVPSDEYTNSLYSQLQDWKYCEVKNGILVVYSGKQKELVLPPGITEIYDKAFAQNTDIERVILPDSVLRIGDGAFFHSSLKEISIPASLKEIGKEAFSFCKHLMSISLPVGIERIPKGVFCGCENLKTIDLPTTIKHVGEDAFKMCKNLKSISLPVETERIPRGAFSNCLNLQTISMPETIKQVGDRAFENCYKLQGIMSFPNIETIGALAFYGCWSLNRIILGSSLKSLGNDALLFHRGNRSFPLTNKVEIEYLGKLTLDTEERREISRKREEEDLQRRRQEDWRGRGVCQYCGGGFKGMIFKTCQVCGRSKDY